jgi:hypothetical protein
MRCSRSVADAVEECFSQYLAPLMSTRRSPDADDCCRFGLAPRPGGESSDAAFGEASEGAVAFGCNLLAR